MLLSYTKSSWSIVIHVYVDFFAFFLMNFMATQLGTVALNVQLAFSNTSGFYFRMPISLSLGLMTYVGG
jgi:MATE family multidrug resistance protein